jgi:hypothetical protein
MSVYIRRQNDWLSCSTTLRRTEMPPNAVMGILRPPAPIIRLRAFRLWRDGLRLAAPLAPRLPRSLHVVSCCSHRNWLQPPNASAHRSQQWLSHAAQTAAKWQTTVFVTASRKGYVGRWWIACATPGGISVYNKNDVRRGVATNSLFRTAVQVVPPTVQHSQRQPSWTIKCSKRVSSEQAMQFTEQTIQNCVSLAHGIVF